LETKLCNTRLGLFVRKHVNDAVRLAELSGGMKNEAAVAYNVVSRKDWENPRKRQQ